MNILVTGGAGFIGSHIVRQLLKRGDKVICLDNFNSYYNPRQKEKNIKEFVQHERFVLYRTDIKDVASLTHVFDGNHVDKICHIAASAGVRGSLQDPDLYVESNIKGTLNILEMMKKYDIKDIVMASSSSVYGNDTEPPFKESAVTERPISPYAATKHSMEVIAYTYHHLYDLNVTALRYFTVYGPAGRSDMAPYKFIDWIYRGEKITRYGDGSTLRDYTYVSDIVDGTITAIDIPLGYEIINLGNSSPVSLNDFIATAEKVVGKKAVIEESPKQPGDVDITCADITKAKQLLGYNPSVSLEEGLTELFVWYKSDNNILRA